MKMTLAVCTALRILYVAQMWEWCVQLHCLYLHGQHCSDIAQPCRPGLPAVCSVNDHNRSCRVRLVLLVGGFVCLLLINIVLFVWCLCWCFYSLCSLVGVVDHWIFCFVLIIMVLLIIMLVCLVWPQTILNSLSGLVAWSHLKFQHKQILITTGEHTGLWCDTQPERGLNH